MKIINAKVLGPDFTFLDTIVTVEDGRFTSLSSADEGSRSEEVIDAKDLIMIPGLIDVHMHGYGGVSCEDTDPQKIRRLGQILMTKGVTGYAATIGSSHKEPAIQGIKANAEACKMEKDQRTGSRILGMHMEGPFLNVDKKGGMAKDCLVPPSMETLKDYIAACGDEFAIKIMTIAPEMEGAEEIIRYGSDNGIHFSMGHTMATAEEAYKGIEWGCDRATHTFNAMRSLNHREVGVLGVSLTDPRIQCEMICDFVHLRKEICLLIYRAKGADKVTMISDSLLLAGLDQSQIPAGIGVEIRDALYLPDGTLCGSTGNVMIGVRNLVSAGIPLEDAVKMASLNPAKDMDMDQELGSIAVGKLADFVLLDKDLNVISVYIEGKKMC